MTHTVLLSAGEDGAAGEGDAQSPGSAEADAAEQSEAEAATRAFLRAVHDMLQVRDVLLWTLCTLTAKHTT